MPDYDYLEKLASQVRRDIIRMVHGAKSGHPGGSLGCTEYFVALYFEIMKHDPNNFTLDGIGEDVFILSNGHISPVFYSVLARSGYFDVKELVSFRKLNSRLQGHPTTYEKLPGIRMSSGSLGQGLSAGIGAAQTKILNNDPSLVYVLTGDGELEEGQIWEAAMYATSHKVDNIIVTVDYNGQQIDGPVDEVMPLGDLKAKWEAFGWMVFEMNGHDFRDIIATINAARENCGQDKPIIILMKTKMGRGVDFMEGTHEWHGVPPNDEEAALALSQLKETFGDF
ncbi:MAG: transketolase [Bacteroidota bacterium]|nr:transketolase [Bacteroidota bacterium]